MRESLRGEVGSVKDPLAIQALGAVLINGSRLKSDPKGFRLVSLALVDALDYCGKPWAVEQLAWLAVDHPTIEARNAAADALKERPEDVLFPLAAIAHAGPYRCADRREPLRQRGRFDLPGNRARRARCDLPRYSSTVLYRRHAEGHHSHQQHDNEL